MKTIFVSILISTFALSASFASVSFAETKKVYRWDSDLTCDQNELSYKFPPAAPLSKEVLIQEFHPRPLVHTEQEVELACDPLVKSWKAVPGASVAFVDIISFHHNDMDSADKQSHRLWLGVFQLEGQNIKWVARTMLPYELKSDAHISFLDFAPYRIKPDTFAFGVRSARSIAYAGGGGSNEDLDLFYVNGSEVRLALSTLMTSSSITAGEFHDDGTREHQGNGNEKPASIAVLKSTTQGFFDLKKSLGKRSAVFKWDGKVYKSADKDPVVDVNSN